MLRVPDRSLPEPAAGRLREYQQEIDTVAVYADRIAEAKRKYRNRKSNATFQEIRRTLRAMCGGIRRCMYCEDSPADEIEHFRPKDLYPEVVFVWSNLLYTCGPCNGNKGGRFYVFAESDGRYVDVTRARGAEVTPPAPGEPVLINPRTDDPLGLLTLDLCGTFRFSPRAQRGRRDHNRAQRTIEVLHLNADFLVESRRNKFNDLLGLLERYARERDASSPSGILDGIKRAISSCPHPTVWAEMKRQRRSFSRIDRLFDHSPEALDW